MRLYEEVIRGVMLDFLVKHPQYGIELYAYYKPRVLFRMLDGMTRSIPSAGWALGLIATFLAIGLFAGPSERFRLSELVPGCAIIWACSLAPPLWAGPSLHVIADQLWSCLFFGSLLVAALVGYAIAVASRVLGAMPAGSAPRPREEPS